jgi:hypothetical protein
MEQDRRKAWGFSLFGDDLRQEVGGKVSLIGIYQEDMIFPGEITLPIVVPRFVVFISYYELSGTLQTDVTFRLSRAHENKVLAEFQMLRKDLSLPETILTTEGESPEDAERIFHARVPMIISPFIIEKLGRVRVRAHYSDGAILKLGSINIKNLNARELQELMVKANQEISKAI